MALHRRQENPQAMQKHVKMAFKVLGRQIDLPAIAHDPAAALAQSRRHRCLLCARSSDKKVTTTCSLATIHDAKIMNSSSVTPVLLRLMTRVATLIRTNGNIRYNGLTLISVITH